MKIGGFSATLRIVPDPSRQVRPQEPTTQAPARDSVKLSPVGSALSDMRAGAARLQALRQAVQGGAYDARAREIASALIDFELR